MNSKALEEALALQQTPTLRQQLRVRPLAEGIDEVLQLAAGSQPLLEDTVARLGRSVDDLQETARFYLQQALFEAGTDAYRILGVTPDANSTRIHQHYRWLQRWLHPDVRGGEWDTVYAARVNQAWSQLRTSTSRQQYDAQRAAHPDDAGQGATTAPAATAVAPAARAEWTAVPVAARRTPGFYAKALALGLLVVVCAGLFVVALRRENRVPPDSSLLANASSGGLPDEADARGSAIERDGRLVPVVLPLLDGVIAHDWDPGPAVVLAPFKPDLVAVALRGPQPGASRKVSTHAPRSHPRAHAPDHQVAAAHRTRRQAATLPTVPKIAVVPERRTEKAPQAPTSIPESVAVAHAAAVPAVQPNPMPTRTPVATGAASAAVQPAVATTVNAPAPVDMLERTRLAREQVRRIVQYLRSSEAAAAERDAISQASLVDEARQTLRQRVGLSLAAGFVLDSPQWRLTQEAVDFRSTYHLSGQDEAAEHGQFRVDMAWQGTAWRLTRIQLQPRS